MCKKFSIIIYLVLGIQIMCITAFSQGFNGIIPLKSNCDDVKKQLSVEDCKIPQSVYEITDYTIIINFTKKIPSANEKICYRVPAGTVSSITVNYKNPIPINAFNYKLEFVKKLDNDISTDVYENTENGITVFASDELIGTAVFYPNKEDHQKYYCPCPK